MASSEKLNNPSGQSPTSEIPSGTNRPVGSSPFNVGIPQAFSGRSTIPTGINIPPSMGDTGPFKGGMPDFSSLNSNTNPFANNPAAQGARINPSPFNGGLGGSSVGAEGSTGTDTMNFKNVMRTITTELQNFSRMLQNLNRGAGGPGGTGGGVGGIAGVNNLMPPGIQQDANGRFRDMSTGRFVSAAAVNNGFQRVFTQQAGIAGRPGMPTGMNGTNASGLPTAPPSYNQQIAMGYQGPLQRNDFAALQQGNNPILAQAATRTAAIIPGSYYVTPGSTDIFGGRVADTFAQQTLVAASQQTMAQQPGGFYGPGGRGGLQNFVRGFFGRPGQMGQQVAVPTVNQVMTDLQMNPTAANRQAAQRYVDQMNAINSGVAANNRQTQMGTRVRQGAIATAKAINNITGTSLSQLAAGVSIIGGGLSSIFAAAEGAAGYSQLEFPMAQAALATGRSVATSTTARRRRFLDLATYGISGEQAQAMQTQFGVASGGSAIDSVAMGLIAGGLDPSTAGRMTRGMGTMGTGFSRGPRDFGLGAMGAARGLGIRGFGLQAQFAEALSGAGQSIIGAGVGFSANALLRQTGRIQRGGRLRGVDALNMATQGVMGNIQASQNIGASVFGGSSLYDMMSFADAFEKTGSLRGARRMMESETAAQTNERLQGAFGGQVTEFAMLGKFTEFQTTEFERRRGGAALNAGTTTQQAMANEFATQRSTAFSNRVITAEAGNLDIMYANQDKIITVLEQNVQLQRQLLDSVSGADLANISTAIMDINKVVVNSSAKIAGLLSQIINGVGKIISWFGGGSTPTPTSQNQTRQRQVRQLQNARRNQPPPPPATYQSQIP